MIICLISFLSGPSCRDDHWAFERKFISTVREGSFFRLSIHLYCISGPFLQPGNNISEKVDKHSYLDMTHIYAFIV